MAVESALTRLVVFTGDLVYSVRKGIVEIDDALGSVEWLILLQSPRKTPAQLLRNQWRNFRRNGWRWIPYQAMDIWQRLTGSAATPMRAQDPGHGYSTAALGARPNVRIERFESIHSPAAIAAVKAFSPTLGLSLAAPILRPALFSVPTLGTVNLHKGRLPDYRGMPPAFWELWNGENSVGCSIHRVDEKLDTGELILADRVERQAHSTVRGLQLQLDELGVRLMREAVEGQLSGRQTSLPQPSGGRTYRKPTLSQVSELQRRLHPVDPAGVVLKRAVRHGVARGAQILWNAGGWRLWAPRITVVLYHRVSDDVRDNLTVGVEQFDRQMALLRQHCQVLSLQEVLNSAHIAPSRKPLVAVTFDDGYLDNFTNAAPILLRHGLPAAFFVSTGIVNSDRQFPHDQRRGNPPIPTMTWPQIRQMQQWGFLIGSHSVSHIDCAGESEDVVRTELAQSRDDLARELGLTSPVFAYPYGGRRHMTPQRLEMVKQAGYSACLSAYGGTNVRSVDRFNVVRRGIHWEYTDRAFLMECLGVR